MKRIVNFVILVILVISLTISCSAPEEGSSGGVSNINYNGKMVLNRNLVDHFSGGDNNVDLTGSKLYIFVYNSSNAKISSFSATSSLGLADVAEYNFSTDSVVIAAEPTNRVFMYVECTGGKYVVLIDKNGNYPQFATVNAISETLGYQSFVNGNDNSQFEAWSTHGLPIGPAPPYLKVTTTEPVPQTANLIE